ncbi:MAG: sigma-70 family RNA polymerase sigma factor [Planctomycetes bacterium]|jgi:RNA polymerase sigma-70 factor (ECF subfamily)|nr:sigma-70 family RNA polymerase sigma factor [Planctomycetota bacterium]MBT4028903.1 sigma-70 family RNA polymerase sigma factor [Planctomycetota bacterium]MBT4561246.1 sigma-70 family RNA polymerase sigma factor [Planctomycetota bacterium]MBT5101623.1 sigma-70 family RNA polymerase sigma factor [Planctomycetota bacterium]MBT7012820.1 sigma-70 family RNA polymerase sigma factor [Planctomycetota bacterium]
MTHENDLSLARRIAARDDSAATELMQSLGGEMLGFANCMLRDHAAAEDALQEAFLAVLRAIEKYDGRVALRAWAFSILRNKIYDILRKRGREPIVSNEDPDVDRFTDGGQWKSGERFDPWDSEAELKRVIQECLDALPHNQREAILLCGQSGLEAQDAAVAMDISYTNFRQTIHRGRKSVRQCVDGKLGATS